MKKMYVGEGSVYLVAGGGKIYADLAAKFVRTEKPVIEIINGEYSPNIIKNLLESHHYTPLEFDNYIFAIEGYSRITETQLVRKRIASYLIKSGRAELHGKRSYNMVQPKEIDNLICNKVYRFINKNNTGEYCEVIVPITPNLIHDMIETWYNFGVENGYKEENLRYMKPQATEFKALVMMNAHALRDWFKIRCCENAQEEIRDLANKMLNLCKQASPDVFKLAGANCKELGYCPEGRLQCEKYKGKIPTLEEMKRIYSLYSKNEK